MSTSTSDHEMSECSNSPLSYTTLESPYSSPSQQVPQLATTLTGLTCTDKNLYNYVNNEMNPFLRIVEQPQNHFRFRYVSEMVGTHGCLLGKSYANNSKTKTHPTVELVNYTGKALIRCQLAQHNNGELHPHKLLEDEQDRDVSYIVPEDGSYKVGFPGMGIIHTAKKDVSNLLFKKFSEQSNNRTAKELRAHCENLAKAMNLNIVRLKFSAHNIETGKEICKPVFSDPIHNMKSAATNDLKICRISMFSGRPRGGEDVFILVEKVNKKNIMIRFYEENENKERVWSDTATFLPSDVHHQYAIVFRTPAYRDPQTAVDVKVFIELVRPTDGRTSEPKEFTYKAEEVYKQIKKRKTTSSSSYSSLDSTSSLTNELPVTVLINNIHTPNDVKVENEIPAFNIQLPLQPTQPASECGLGNALGTVHNIQQMPTSPMWFQPSTATPVPPTTLPQLQLDSAELNNIITREDVVMEDAQATQAGWAQYMNLFNSSLGDTSEINGMDFLRTALVADSGRVKTEPSTSLRSSSSPTAPASKPSGSEQNKGSSNYPAFFKPDDAAEVKKLVKELCEMIRNKKGLKNQEVKSKLERLFDIRLSNGDTFLHMTLCNNLPSFEAIVRVIHSVKMSHLLNYANNNGETILHLAAGMPPSVVPPSVVPLLIAKGCDPMLKNTEGENAVHLVVRYNPACLGPLLDAVRAHGVPCSLDARNAEQQSALHLCALHNTAESAALLVARGADYGARDAAGRTPLHLCAYDARPLVARALLSAVRASDVDAVDGRGNTALQIVCGRALDDATLEMAELLLARGADPLRRGEHAPCAWRLARDKPPLREVLRLHVPPELAVKPEPDDKDLKCEPDDMDLKSEPDDQDDYESADEEVESAGLAELNLYVRSVSAAVERAGRWRELARRLGSEALLSWFENQPSPTSVLLQHVKECRSDITSKSLALILEDMGLNDAANVIKSSIE